MPQFEFNLLIHDGLLVILISCILILIILFYVNHTNFLYLNSKLKKISKMLLFFKNI